jgi:gliding motility-associated-like protein
MKTMKKITVIITALLLLSKGMSYAQMAGTEAYLHGTHAEVGISGVGGFEGADTTLGAIPGGMHFRSGNPYFGFVADPQLSGWTQYDGDFFSPGSPENGWGFEIGNSGGATGSNNCANSGIFGTGQDIPGSLTYSTNGTCLIATWDGDATTGTNLHWRIQYLLHQNDLYYTTTVSVTNNTAAPIDSLFYYRNVDPDNDESVSFNFTTANKIIAEPNATCQLAHVCAAQGPNYTFATNAWYNYMGFAAVGANFRVNMGGFANRDASDIWYGNGASYFPAYSHVVNDSTEDDDAISLAYLVHNLAPGATETFKFVVILSSSAAGNAINNLTYLTYPGSLTAPPPDCTPFVDTIRTCGSPVPIAVSGSVTGSYSWAWTPTTGLTTSTGPSTVANPPTTTTYTLTGTPLAGTCALSPITMTFVVKVTPLGGAAPVIQAVPPMCLNDPAINLVVDSLGGTWSGQGCSSTGVFTPSVAGVGTWIITYTRGSVCNSTDTVAITVNASGNPTITTPPSFCLGAGATYTFTAATAGGTWSGTGINPVTGVFDPVTAGVGSFLITYTLTGTCTTFDTTMAVVNASANPLIAQPSPVCVGAPAYNLSVSVAGGVWSGTGIVNATTGTFDPATAGLGNHIITYTISGACPGQDTVICEVDPTYNPAISSYGPMCQNASPFFLSAASAGGVWSGTGVTNPSLGVFDPATAGPGVWPVTYTVTGLCGFASTTNLTVIANPYVAFTADTTQGCAPTTIHFKDTVSQTGGTYFWNFGFNNTALGDTSHVANPSFTYPAAGSYTVYFSYTNSFGCSNDTTITNYINIHSQPIANFTSSPQPTTIYFPDIDFHDLSMGLINNWNWNFYGYGTSTLQNPHVTYTDTGTYAVRLIVSNIYGCIDTADRYVEILPYYTCYAPDAFTPNGDGENDEFRVYGHFIDPSNFDMGIYDRWGERIFHTNDLNAGWNGAKNNSGEICEIGVYVYNIVLKDWHGIEHKYYGHVTLIK